VHLLAIMLLIACMTKILLSHTVDYCIWKSGFYQALL
jgi:hypothetical protein